MMDWLKLVRGRVNGPAAKTRGAERPEEDHARVLDDAREPTIWFRREAWSARRSRLGGLPSLPPGRDWPRHAETGLPLHFLAQIDCAVLPRTPLKPGGPTLPRTGLLLFFADIDAELVWDESADHPAATRVLFVPSPGLDRPAPADLPAIGHTFGEAGDHYAHDHAVFGAAPVRAYEIYTFVGKGYFQYDVGLSADMETIASIARGTGEPVPVVDRAARAPDASAPSARVVEWRRTDGTVTREAELVRHQMLSASDVQSTAADAREAGHVLLLQLDTDWGLERAFQFCDMGMVQFWIRPEDLAAGRFDRAWATTEGG